MWKTIDITGHIYGKLKVMGKLGKNKFGSYTWDCECECGNHKTVTVGELRNGSVKSCGCLKGTHLIGKKFDRLTVIDMVGVGKTNHRLWLCKCDCGGERVVATNNLTQGRVRSCGCLRTELSKRWGKDRPGCTGEAKKDSDVDILASNIRDLTLAISNQIDSRIWNVMTESQSVVNINTNATEAAWDAASYTSVNIVEDIMEAKQNIRVNSGFSPEGAVLFLSPKDHRSMINWLIDGKGSSIPSFASARLTDGVVMEILGLRVVVSNNVTADYAAVVIPKLAVTWKTFTGLTSAVISEPGIGKKIRIWEEGEAILERPKCVNLITNTAT